MSDTIDNELINGNNNIGELVFIEKQYNAENIAFGTFENVNAQQHDILKWQGDTSIAVTSPTLVETILTKGSNYYLIHSGEYTFRSLVNQSKTATIQAAVADDNTIEIDNIDTPNGFEVFISNKSFILDEEKVVSINVTVDDDVETGKYNISLDINNETVEYEFTVIENLAWEVALDTLNNSYVAKNGDNIYLGYVLLENKGNKDVEIEVLKTGVDNHLLIIPRQQTLYKKAELRVEFSVQVPTTQKPKSVNHTIFITGGEGNYTKEIQLDIKDAILPNIESINFSTDKAFKKNRITAIATDNNEVKNMTLNYNNNTVVFNKNNQVFTTTVTFRKLSAYNLVFCAYDVDNNKNCVEVNRSFEETELVVDIENDVTLPTKKISQYARTRLFKLTQNTPEGVVVVLSEFLSTTQSAINNSYNIRVVDGDGSIKGFDKYNNEVTINKAGNVFLEVRSVEAIDYQGMLTLDLPEYATSVGDIQFTASFKDYDVPESFVKEWSYDSDLRCDVVDTGDLSDTHYKCTFQAPISIRPNDISIPTTISEREAFENKASEVEEELKNQKRRAATLISFLVVIVLATGGFAYYMLAHYPYVRITKGHKLKYKYNRMGDKKYQR